MTPIKTQDGAQGEPQVRSSAWFGVWCPECKEQKPREKHDQHDIVIMRMDWRRAERNHIDEPIPQSPMCLQCFHRIQEEYSPKAPTFDAKGNRVKENTPNDES